MLAIKAAAAAAGHAHNILPPPKEHQLPHLPCIHCCIHSSLALSSSLLSGHYVIIVSSGAVGVGCQRLGLSQRPTKLAQKQALAAIGQVHLMRYYEDILNALGLVSIGY